MASDVETRTLGSLTADDIGKRITVRRGPATWTGVLADIRHQRGATSGRKVTTYSLLWRDSYNSLQKVENHHSRPSPASQMPDDSETPCEVDDE